MLTLIDPLFIVNLLSVLRDSPIQMVVPLREFIIGLLIIAIVTGVAWWGLREEK